MLNVALIFTLILNLSLNVICVQNNNNNNDPNKQKNEEVFEQDLTDTFKIEGSDQGIQRVNLKCGADSMNIILETEKPFSGVMYTRGSFHKQQSPCFVKPKNSNTHTLEMNFELSQCQTQQDGELYSNIVVVQNDPELIMPGDSAFSLECDFRQPRNVDVGANFQTRDRTVSGSRITLTSPDPGANINGDHLVTSVFNASDNVAYSPKTISIDESNRDNDAFEIKEEMLHMGTVEEIVYNLEKDEL